jgi:hypothetical protein
MSKKDQLQQLEDERLVSIELSDDSQDQDDIERDEPIEQEVMSVAEASKRINQLSRFIGKVRARKGVYETMLRQENSVSDNVQTLVHKALEQLQAESESEGTL